MKHFSRLCKTACLSLAVLQLTTISQPLSVYAAEQTTVFSPASKQSVEVTSYYQLVQECRKALISGEVLTVYYDGILKTDNNQLWTDIHDYVPIMDEDFMEDNSDARILVRTLIAISDSTGLHYRTKITFTFVNQQDTKSNLATLDKKLTKISKSFGFTEDTTVYEKVQTIHDYICKTYSYDTVNSFQPLLKTFSTSKFQCSGYAALFYSLAVKNDIPCRYINGYNQNGEFHIWNMVQMEDGKWYYVDCTWDDSESSDNYFLIGSNRLETTHTIWNAYTMCLEQFYDVSYSDYQLMDTVVPESEI